MSHFYLESESLSDFTLKCVDSKVLSFGYTGIFSTKTGVTFSLLVLVFEPFFGKEILIDRDIKKIPERVTNNVFQKDGKPKNGIRKIKIPKKNVLFRSIIELLYISKDNSQNELDGLN